MPYITSVERIGREIGRKEGKAEGKAEERQSLVSLQLRQKVGPLPKPIRDRITQLSPDHQQALAIALLDFDTIADLEAWLADH
jgi:predicted transposase YdaD